MDARAYNIQALALDRYLDCCLLVALARRNGRAGEKDTSLVNRAWQYGRNRPEPPSKRELRQVLQHAMDFAARDEL